MPFFDLNKRYGLDSRELVVSNEEAINEALDNILGTRPGERVFNRGFGSNLAALLFDPISEQTALRIQDRVFNEIVQLEPRIILPPGGIRVTPFPDEGRYEIRITYRIRTGGQGTYQRRVDATG